MLASLKISRGSDRLCVLQSSACATLPNLQAAVPHIIIMANDNTRKRRSKRHLGEPVALVSRVLHLLVAIVDQKLSRLAEPLRSLLCPA